MLRRMEKRVAKLERRGAKLERENKALRAGQDVLLEALGQMSSAFEQCVETMQARASSTRPREKSGGRSGKPHRLPRARAAAGLREIVVRQRHIENTERLW